MVLLNTCWWLGSWNRCPFFRTGTAKRDVCLVQLDLRILLQNFAKEIQAPSSSFIQYCSLPPFLVCSKKSCTHFVPQSFGGGVFSKNLDVDLAQKIKSKRKTATLINSFIYIVIFSCEAYGWYIPWAQGDMSSITFFPGFHKTKHVITYTVTTFSFVDKLELKDKAVFLSEVLFLVAFFSGVRNFM